ncbi:MAG: TRAM domain-containing protein [Actinomycetes bacterium]
MTIFTVGEKFEVELGPVAHGGHVVARHEGRVIFVRHGIPGELVTVEVTGVSKNFARGDVIEVLVPSEHRVDPPCRFAKECGGCDFQHIDVAEQRNMKKAVIVEQFARLAKRDVEVEVIDLGQHTGWRTRMRYAVDSEGHVGLRGAKSHDVVRLDKCVIAHDGIQPPRGNFSHTSEIEMAISSEGEIRGFRDGRLDDDLSNGSSSITEMVHGTRFNIDSKGFWQVHPRAASMFVNTLLEFAQMKPGDHVIDLYGGAGLFAAFALEEVGPGGRVELVDSTATSVRDAARNFPALKAHVGEVLRVLRSLKRADVILLDPPRTGAGRPVLEQIAKLKPRRVVYVACDPAALARDVATFAELGYELAQLRAFDAFPMTHHVEQVAAFTLA